jgi:hypothetical protein
MPKTKQQEINETNNWIPRGWIRASKLDKDWKPSVKRVAKPRPKRK